MTRLILIRTPVNVNVGYRHGYERLVALQILKHIWNQGVPINSVLINSKKN